MTANQKERIEEIQSRLDERDDSGAMLSACGEYNCPCHYDIEFLLSLVEELAREQ